MPRVLFIQNGEQDGPGLFAKVLSERGVDLDVVHPWRGDAVPHHARGYAGIALGGGHMSAYQQAEFPYLAVEEELIRNARATRVPMLGMCLGAQLMAQTLGGRVYANDRLEIGFYDVRFSPAAESDPLWRGYTNGFQPVHWHGDTFTIPHGGTLLASSDITPHQLFRIDDLHYGFQFHLEIDLPVLTEMVATDDGSLPAVGVDPKAFLRDAQTVLPNVEPIGRAVFGRWTELLQ